MSYVPPHKRLSSTQSDPPPTPEQLAPRMKKNLNLRSDWRTDKHASTLKRIVYADQSISRCLAVPLQDDGQIPPSVRLVQVSPESFNWKDGEKPLTLVSDLSQQECGDVKNCHLRSPWASMAEMVHSDLISASQNVKNEMADGSLEEIKPVAVVRFGKVLFHRSPSLSIESLKEYSVSEAHLRGLRRVFHTDVPSPYVEHIKNEVVPKIGVDFWGEKERYRVKLADAKQPGSIISCKCRIQEGEKKLELHKIESSPLRHLVVDTSCLDSSVDLRLALCTKKNITAVTDEKQSISDLISSAILDPNVKGGLKWPLGIANSGARYSVIGVWHTKSEFYSNSSMKLKVREADRYDFLTSAGYVTWEISLKLTGMARILMEPGDNAMAVSTSLKDRLRLIWDHFLSWQGSLVPYCE